MMELVLRGRRAVATGRLECEPTRHQVLVGFWVGLVVTASLAGVGCGDGGSESLGVTTTSAAAADAVYLAQPDDGWALKEAYNPSPENSLTRSVEPSLDWYAEYEAPPANSPRRVRLSGHAADREQVAAELKGFTLTPARVGSSDGVAGTASDPIGPSVVVFGVRKNYSALALSYELPMADLLEWSGHLQIITESEWTQSGGRVDR